jgi:predicted DNA-binding protein YlxM (UPF0122 family)
MGKKRKKRNFIRWPSDPAECQEIIDTVVVPKLVAEKLFKPETGGMSVRVKFMLESFLPVERDFDTCLMQDPKSNLDSLFYDPIKERRKWLEPTPPGSSREFAASFVMRRAPVSLRESVARDLVETNCLESFSTGFKLTAFLISRGIRDRETIEEVFPYISWREFQFQQPRVERLISSAIEYYFAKFKTIDPRLGKQIWKKFYAAWNRLTRKQKSALQIHIMAEDPVSLEEGAKRLKISKAAFKERVESGKKKIEKALKELNVLKKIQLAKNESAAPQIDWNDLKRGVHEESLEKLRARFEKSFQPPPKLSDWTTRLRGKYPISRKDDGARKRATEFLIKEGSPESLLMGQVLYPPRNL